MYNQLQDPNLHLVLLRVSFRTKVNIRNEILFKGANINIIYSNTIFASYFIIMSEEGAWKREVDNKWCRTEYGNDWSASISSQVECQELCLKTPFCVGISYSYRAGMTHSCFFCKNDALETNSYGFGFYRMPGKILSLSNTKYTLQLNCTQMFINIV